MVQDPIMRKAQSCLKRKKMETYTDVKRRAKPTELKAGEQCFNQTYRCQGQIDKLLL